MALRDILVKFGVQVQGVEQITDVTRKTKEATGALTSLGARLGWLARFTALGYLARTVRDFVSSQIEAATALKYQAEKLGISTDELKKFQYVAARMKVPVNEMAVAMRFFNRAVGEVALGTRGTTKIFHQMGLSVKDAHGNIKPTDQLLFEFSDKLAAIPSQAVRTAFAMRALGRGGSALLPVLQHGSEALKKQFALYEAFTGGPSAKVIQLSDEIKGKLMLQQLGWKAIYSTISAEVLPIVNKWLDKSNQNIKVLVDLAQNTYGVATALRFLAVALPVAAMVLYTTKALLAGEATTKILGTMAMSGVVVTLAAVIGTLYLAFDQLYSTLSGADTSLGQLLDDTKGFGAAKQWVADFKGALDGLVKAILGPDAQLGTLLEDAEFAFADALPSIIRVSVKALTGLALTIDTIITGIRQMLALLRAADALSMKNAVAWGLSKVLPKGAMRDEAESKVSQAEKDIKGVQDIGAIGGDWLKRVEAYQKVYNVAGEIPDAPKGYMRQLRARRDAEQVDEARKTGVPLDMDRDARNPAPKPHSSSAVVPAAVPAPSKVPAEVPAPSKVSNTVHSNTTNNIHVHTASTNATPREIADVVQKAVAKALADRDRAVFATTTTAQPDPLAQYP